MTDPRKDPGTWVEPRFDPEGLEHEPPEPPARAGASDEAHDLTTLRAAAALGATGMHLTPAQGVRPLADTPVGGEPAGSPGRGTGINRDVPREFEGDETRPD